MKLETSYFSGAGGTRLPYMIWEPETAPIMVLQVTHGMTEHIGRYESLARELTTYGIVVAGFDLRGHGKNSFNHDTATLGKNGWEKSLTDMHRFRLMLNKRYVGLPLYMMGFSLGSFLLREYLSHHKAPDGAILVGTGTQPTPLLSVLMWVAKGEINKSGFNQNTPLVQKLSFETYNKQFKPNRTPSDWLCSDNTQLDAYLKDSRCRACISAGLFYDLLASMKRTGAGGAYRNWKKSMPVLLISGEADPVGNMGKGVKQVQKQMEKAGLTNVQMQLYSDARHDVLHEELSGSAREARNLIFEWLFKNYINQEPGYMKIQNP